MTTGRFRRTIRSYGKAGYRPEIYSIGHRTVMGLAFHPTTGVLWETENGSQGGDEVNIIRPGKNYGWPLVTFGHDYDGTPLHERAGADEYGIADDILGAVDYNIGNGVLHRRSLSDTEKQSVRRLDDRRTDLRYRPSRENCF